MRIFPSFRFPPKDTKRTFLRSTKKPVERVKLRMGKNVDSFKSSPIFRFINFLNPYSRVSVEFGDKDPNTYFSGEC